MRVLLLLVTLTNAQIVDLISRAADLENNPESINEAFFDNDLGVGIARAKASDFSRLQSLQRIVQIESQLKTLMPGHASDFHIPHTLGDLSARIEFLANKLYESAEQAVAGSQPIADDSMVSAWAIETLGRGFYGIEQMLFTISQLYEEDVAQVGRDLWSNKAKSPQKSLGLFMAFMRNIQLKGHLLWSAALDIVTSDAQTAIQPIRAFITASNSQRYSFDETKVYDIVGHPVVGVRHVIFQSFLRVPDMNKPEEEGGGEFINTQGFYDLWEHIKLVPLSTGGFHLKSGHWGTFLKALPGDGGGVVQTRDGGEIGCTWQIEKIGVDVTRSYFGKFTGIKTVHGTLWAEGITRTGRSVLTTAAQVSQLTQFTIEQVEEGSSSVYVTSPSGKFLTENSFSGSYDLLDEPTNESIFIVEDLEDNFFSLKGFSTAYTSTEPGLSSLVKSEWVQGDWEKLQRVNAPDDAYHIVSAFGSYLYLDGPPEAAVYLHEGTPGYESKWEIVSDMEDISAMFN